MLSEFYNLHEMQKHRVAETTLNKSSKAEGLKQSHFRTYSKASQETPWCKNGKKMDYWNRTESPGTDSHIVN